MNRILAILLLCAGVTGYGQDVGCGHPHACNYDADAIHDNDLCWFTCNVGCTSPYSCMYASENYYDNGSCTDVGCEFNYYACDFVVCDFDVPVYGCTDCAAFNYNPCATDDDGSCEPITIGCPMPFACNYDVAANTLGYCDFWSCYQGCLDETACNYDPEALGDDGSCYFPEEGCDCDGGGCCCPEGCNYPACLSDDNDGVCDCLGVTGCVDPSACNYNPMATEPDGSCFYDSCYGCTEEWACNYDANAIMDDGSCEYPEIIDDCGYCGGEVLEEYDCNGDGLCDSSYDIFGCVDENACNYEVCATFVADDGSQWECFYPEFGYNCDGTCLSDVDGDGVCDLLEIEGCLDSEACNFDSLATDDDSSCHYDCQFCLEGTVWSEELGGCVVANVSDTDFDGCVGINDFLVHLSNFGSGCGPESAWACGDPLEYQGYDYETVLIGEQCWFAENLRSENYKNGDSIPAQLSEEEWGQTSEGATAIFGEGDSYVNGAGADEEMNLTIHGRLYNGFAVQDSRGLCPLGWSVSAAQDWADLRSHLEDGSLDSLGVELRTAPTWNSSGAMVGRDSQGMSWKGSGNRMSNGHFNNMTIYGEFRLRDCTCWAETGYGAVDFWVEPSDPKNGASVRCIKD